MTYEEIIKKVNSYFDLPEINKTVEGMDIRLHYALEFLEGFRKKEQKTLGNCEVEKILEEVK